MIIINESKTRFDGMTDSEIIGRLQSITSIDLDKIYSEICNGLVIASDRSKDFNRDKKIQRIIQVVNKRYVKPKEIIVNSRPNPITLKIISSANIGSVIETDSNNYKKIDNNWWIDEANNKISNFKLHHEKVVDDPSAMLREF